MITIDDKLRIQAYIDGELDRAEAKEVEDLIASDVEARSLYDELKSISILTKENEPEVKVSVSRELYWQQIYSKIQEEETKPVSVLGYLTDLIRLAFSRRYFAPVAAMVVLVASIFTVKEIVKPSEDYLVVIENIAEEVGSYSFRNSTEKMFVVWIYNKDVEHPKPIKEEVENLMLEEGVIYQ